MIEVEIMTVYMSWAYLLNPMNSASASEGFYIGKFLPTMPFPYQNVKVPHTICMAGSQMRGDTICSIRLSS